MKLKLLLWPTALLLVLLGLRSNVEVAMAKEASVVLSGGNLEQPVLVPWHGAIEPVASSQRRLFFPAKGSDAPAMEVYDVAYRMELFSVGQPMRGTYVPRPSAEGSIYVAEGSGVETFLYLTTPQFDEVLKLYLVAALERPGLEIPSVEAARSLSGEISFHEAMARSGIGSRVVSLQLMFPRLDSATSDSETANEKVGGDWSATAPTTKDIVSSDSAAPDGRFRLRLSQVVAGGALGIVAVGALVGFALRLRKRRPDMGDGSRSVP